jgi:hypothetical protein
VPYTGLRKHMRTEHPGECLVCDFRYGQGKKHPSYYVRVHMGQAHLFGEFACHACDFIAVFPQGGGR